MTSRLLSVDGCTTTRIGAGLIGLAGLILCSIRSLTRRRDDRLYENYVLNGIFEGWESRLSRAGN
jgi:hypothetical protein